MKIKSIYKISVIIFSIVIVSACSNHFDKNTTGGKEKIKVLRLAYQLGHLPDIVAKSKHWFEDEFKNDSIEIQYKKFDFGIPEVEAFVAHKLDFGSIGDQPAIIGWANGAG